MDGRQQVGADVALDHVGERAGGAGGLDKRRVVVHGQEDNPRRTWRFREVRRHGEAAHDRHRDVEDDDIWLQHHGGIQGGLAVAHRPDHVEFLGDDSDDAFEHRRMVIGEQHPGASHGSVKSTRVDIRLPLVMLTGQRAHASCFSPIVGCRATRTPMRVPRPGAA
jgi:hypothetical protein